MGRDKIVSIHLLRAIAAIGVVAAHCEFFLLKATGSSGALLPARIGLSGVDVFFVISGFIMVYTSGPLFGQAHAATAFLSRRLIRIVPLYWLATSLYLLIAAALPALGKSYAPATIAASYLFIPWPQADGTWQPIVGQGWTLNYEMLFYVLFAAAILQRARLAVAAVATVLGLGIIAGFFLPPEWRMLHFWSDPIVAEFALGMAVGLLQRSGVTLRAATRLVLVAIAVGALAVTAFGPFADFPSWARPIVWGLPAMLIVAACALRPEPTRPGLSLAGRIAIALGNASYAIYLFHSFPVRGLLAAALWLHLDALVAGAAASWLFVLLAVLGSIALALAIHYAFERPVTALLRSRAVLTPKWREAGASRA